MKNALSWKSADETIMMATHSASHMLASINFFYSSFTLWAHVSLILFSPFSKSFLLNLLACFPLMLLIEAFATRYLRAILALDKFSVYT